MNLFFVHTPFQILVAQNLIVKKKLINNIVVLANTGKKAKHFYKTFDIMLIDKLWAGKYILGDLNNGIFSFKKPFISLINLHFFFNRSKRVILENEVMTLYFGDINHPAYIFLAEYWQNKKEINFFEEGLSHYYSTILKKKFDDLLIVRIKKIITDLLIFGPFGIKDFSKYLQTTENINYGFKINKKYNLLPVEENNYDEIITFDIFKSKKLQDIIGKEKQKYLDDQASINILYLSSTLTSLFSQPLEDEKMMILHILKKNVGKKNILLKFHPKDSDQKKENLKLFLEKQDVNFVEILSTYSFPIEVLFNYIRIDLLIGFGSSSQLYFEMLCPNTPNYNLCYNLARYYEEKSIDNDYPNSTWRNWKSLYWRIFNKESMKL